MNHSVQRTRECLSLESTSTVSDGGHEVEVTTSGKPIYMVSDGTGWTAEHSVNAALGQFEHCLVDRGCPVNTHLFSGGIFFFHLVSLLNKTCFRVTNKILV